MPQGLAQEVACYLGLQLGGIRVKRFADGEIYVQVQESIRGCDVFLVQPTSPPVNDHLMELLVMIDACRRASARSITAVVSDLGMLSSTLDFGAWASARQSVCCLHCPHCLDNIVGARLHGQADACA